MEEGHRICAVKWLSSHIDEPLDTLKDREYNYEEEWDWNIGQMPTDPILGIALVWDKAKGVYVPFHVSVLEGK